MLHLDEHAAQPGAVVTTAAMRERRWRPLGSLARALLRHDSAGQLVTTLIAAAVIPLLLFIGWTTYTAASRARMTAQAEAVRTAAYVADRIVAELSMHLQVAEALAASSALDQPSLHAFYLEAQRARSTHPLWYTIELADPSGMQILNLLRDPDAPLGPTADWASFQKVVRTQASAVGGIGPVGTISGRRLVSLRVPVVRDDQLRYVLSIALAPAGISAILRGAGAPPDWVGGLVDADGRIIARTLAEETEFGQPASPALRAALDRAAYGFYRGPTLEGIEVDTVYRTLQGTGGWSVHLGIPSETLNAPVRRSLYLVAGSGLVSLALAAALACITARDLTARRRREAARAEMDLQTSEDHRRVALAAAELGTWRWDIGRGEITGCPRAAALLDRLDKMDEDGGVRCRPEALFQAVHEEDQRRVNEAIRHALTWDEAVDLEFRAACAAGGYRWLRLSGRAQRREDAGEAVLHGVLADIEPDKQAEAERLDLLSRLAQAQENEQSRIARELHDQVGQTVTALSLGLKSLERTLDREGLRERMREPVEWLRTLAMEIGRDIHRAATDLRPTALDDLGLHRALLAHAAEWSEHYGVPVDVQTVGAPDRMSPEIETAVYRVVQEALTNVAKHAEARHVGLVLERRGRHLRVIVEDDGKGFDPGLAGDSRRGDAGDGPRRCLGLSGMRERLVLIGGSLSLETAPGAGTTLFIRIPCRLDQAGRAS